ncbi:MAG: HAD-IIIA family hydrolase [Saprospiraceae bacterium]|nr:HAD-IIIA family hydrolase [Saprospiraceae bacterium]
MDFISNINSDWSLFLDRDGVINKKLENDYVKNLEELELISGSIEAIAALSSIFSRIFIVTNQQGIGKQLMTKEDLNIIHNAIDVKVIEAGGRIDAFYFAPQLEKENSPMRKPNIGMALAAKKEFPEVNFSTSIMVGDAESDMKFGENAGMNTVRIAKSKISKHITVPSLIDFANLFSS